MIIATSARIAIIAALAAPAAFDGAMPQRFAPTFGCTAWLPAPHPSGGRIKAHMRITCKRPVAAARVDVQLWRKRSWGWEQIGEPGSYVRSRAVRTVDASATASVAEDECSYYRSTGTGYIVDGKGARANTPGEGVNFDERFKRGLPPGCGSAW